MSTDTDLPHTGAQFNALMSPQSVSRAIDWSIRLLIGTVLLLLLLQQLGLLDRTITIPNSSIVPLQGHGFYVTLTSREVRSFLIYRTRSDIDGTNQSTLQLFEDGRPLGPPHSQHIDIFAEGAGRYSHWGDGIMFSARDSSDPRANGRQYDARFPPQAIHLFVLPSLLLITLFAWRIRVGHSVGHMFEIAATRPLIERISAIHSRLSYRIVRYCRYHLGLPFLVHAFAIFALLLFTIATALESGVWKTAEHFRGPFRTADNATGMVIVPVARELPLRPIVSARSDSVIFGSQSDLTLRVNGESWGSVRDNPPSRFTHWNGYLHVKLPPQLPNDATTTFDVEYSVRLHPYVLNSR